MSHEATHVPLAVPPLFLPLAKGEMKRGSHRTSDVNLLDIKQ